MNDVEIQQCLNRMATRRRRGIPEERWPELDRRLDMSPQERLDHQRRYFRLYMRRRRSARP
jgi:hypothetical protein